MLVISLVLSAVLFLGANFAAKRIARSAHRSGSPVAAFFVCGLA